MWEGAADRISTEMSAPADRPPVYPRSGITLMLVLRAVFDRLLNRDLDARRKVLRGENNDFVARLDELERRARRLHDYGNPEARRKWTTDTRSIRNSWRALRPETVKCWLNWRP
jgi:hypothetical protein